MDNQEVTLCKTLPLVSVIIPVFNGGHFLSEAIDSVLKQRYAPLEILVIDDGSTDGTSTIANKLSHTIQYIHQAHSGPSSGRNNGLTRSKGEIIAFLDVDDLWPEDKLALQVPWLLQTPEIDVVMGRVEIFGTFTAQERSFFGKRLTRTFMHVCLGASIFKRRVFQKVGCFDEELQYSEDHDWFLRAREMGIGLMIMKQVALYHRVHEHSMTSKKEAAGFQLPKVLKKSLERRRQTHKSRPMPLPKASTICDSTLKP